MDKSKRSFSSSTLTMKDSRSRPRSSSSDFRRTQTGVHVTNHRNGTTDRSVPPWASRRGSSNLSEFYNNNNRRSSLVPTTPVAICDFARWGISKKLLSFFSAFAYGICNVFTAVYCIVNLQVLKVDLTLASIPLLLAGILSMCFVISCRNFLKTQIPTKGRSSILLGTFNTYLIIGMALIMVSNVYSFYINQETDGTGNFTYINNNTIYSGFNDGGLSKSTIFIHQNISSLKITPAIESNTAETETTDHEASELSELPRPNSIKSMMLNAEFLDRNASTPIVVLINQSRQLQIPIFVRILAGLGYAMVGSTFCSSYYILLSLTGLSAQPEELHSATRMMFVIAAVGAAAFGFLGTLDLGHLWSSPKQLSYALEQWSVLSGVVIVVLLVTTVVSLLARHFEDIQRKLKSIKKLPSEGFFPQDRRPTRTAQEIFDEVAPLLGHRGGPRGSITSTSSPALLRHTSPDEMDGLAESYLSRSTASQSGTIFEDSIVSAPVARPDVIRYYPYHQVLPLTSSNRFARGNLLVFLKKRRSLFFCMGCVFLISCSGTSMIFNVAYFLEFVNKTRNVDEDGSRTRIPNFLRGTQITSAAMFVLHVVFVAFSFAFQQLLPKVGWKRMCLAVSMLVAILSYPLVLSRHIILFFLVVCAHGMLRVLAMLMPQLITSQTLRSQIGFQTTTIKQSLLDSPTTVLWCMEPLSLAVSSIVIAPCISATGYNVVWVLYSATSATLAAFGLLLML